MLYYRSRTENWRLSTVTHFTRLGKIGGLTRGTPHIPSHVPGNTTYDPSPKPNPLCKSHSTQHALFSIPIFPQTTPLSSGPEGDTPPQLPTPQVSQPLGSKPLPTVPSPLPSAAPPSGSALPPSPRAPERVSSPQNLVLEATAPASHSLRPGEHRRGLATYSSQWPHLSSKSSVETPPPPVRK